MILFLGNIILKRMVKKKMDKIVYEFDPKIYPRSLFVMKGCDPKDVTDRFTTRDDSEFEIEIEEGSEPSMSTLSMVKFKDTGKYGELVVVWIDDKDVDMSMISHEAFHVSMNILSELGIKFHADNQEPIAYMVGWCARCISDVVSGEVGISDCHAGYRLDDIMIIFSHLDISPRSFVGAFCLSLSKT